VKRRRAKDAWLFSDVWNGVQVAMVQTACHDHPNSGIFLRDSQIPQNPADRHQSLGR
jgi:hypothetical protein